MKISTILLAGGKGMRMENPLPKQFLPLQGKTIAQHSLEVFLDCLEINEIIVVCAPQYRHFFSHFPVQFAQPGPRRQDSVFNGLQQVSSKAKWVSIHDAARPFITSSMLKTLYEEGEKVGAASLGMPVKNTLKQIHEENKVAQTVDRSHIWEIQTPQLIRKDLLEAGFAYAQAHNLTVTDDVSLVELIDHPVKLVAGSYQNLKITTPEDLFFAQYLCQNIKSASPMMEPPSVAGKSNPTEHLSKA